MATRYVADSSNRQFEMPLPNNLSEAFNEAGEALEKLFEEGLPAAGISQGEITGLIWIGVCLHSDHAGYGNRDGFCPLCLRNRRNPDGG